MSSTSRQSSDTVNVQRSEDLVWPSHETDQPLAIRRYQFEVLKRAIDRCEAPSDWLGKAAWLFIGLGATAGLSWLSLVSAQTLSAWVKPTFSVVALAALILGLILLRIERREQRRVHQDISVVKEEFKHLEAQYPSVGSSVMPQAEMDEAAAQTQRPLTAKDRQISS